MAIWMVLFSIAAAASLVPSSSAECSSATFSDARIYSRCKTLFYLGSSLHWTYHPCNITVDLAFRANINPPAWIAWGINPTAPRMIGAQALVAVVAASGNVTAYPSPIPSYSPSVQRGNLSITVFHISAAYSGGTMTIFATISLPNNSTLVSHVWQSSSTLAGGVPGGHLTAGDNILSKGTLNFLYGERVSNPTHLHLKKLHGIYCTVGWGILAPFGFFTLVGFRSTNTSRLSVQVAIYWVAYIIGTLGWVTGLVLGNESAGIEYHSHRSIGITIFILATIHMGDLGLKSSYIPLGLCVIILSIVNIVKGFHIHGGAQGLRTAYIAVVSTLGALQLVLWIVRNSPWKI